MKDAHTGKKETDQRYEPAPYVGTALIFKNLVLLAKRIEVCPCTNEKVKYGGHWSIFCGAVEEGESRHVAAHREVLEETGMDLDKSMFIHQGKIEDLRLYTYKLNDMVHPELNYEHTEWGYFRIDKISISPSPMDEKVTQKLKEVWSEMSNERGKQ
jgi:8-oxo-dGTP pyrophosphatase MutT (NUDIX family)